MLDSNSGTARASVCRVGSHLNHLSLQSFMKNEVKPCRSRSSSQDVVRFQCRAAGQEHRNLGPPHPPQTRNAFHALAWTCPPPFLGTPLVWYPDLCVPQTDAVLPRGAVPSFMFFPTVVSFQSVFLRTAEQWADDFQKHIYSHL